MICGCGYTNHNDELVNCTDFAATNYATLGHKVNGRYQTKGTYSMLVDPVNAFSDAEYVPDYMLIFEDDLKFDAGFGADMAARINAVMNRKH